MIIILFVIVLVIGLIYAICIESKDKKMLAERNKRITNGADTHVRDNKTNTIRRSDNEPISKEEIPDLIRLGYQHAIEQEKQSKNPKFHRTFKEEELSFQFETNHWEEIQKHTDIFEEGYRLACAEKDLNKKIELLQKTIIKFEKIKNWFYLTKGGTIYFQDRYEHLHNSRNDDFYYIDQIKEDLEECIKERDYVIPKILNTIKSSNGILQKNIYQYLADVSKGDIQRVIRKLESEGKIAREKSKGSYLLTIKETQ